MNSDNEDIAMIYFITMVGMYGVGKTSILNKLKKNHFVKSYKPTEDKKIIKHIIQENTINDLQDQTVKISFKDSSGLSSTTPSDQTFLQRKAHILCFVYDYDNKDSFQCIKYLLQENDQMYSSNRIIMVIRNKVDNKSIISESEQDCNDEFNQITSINEEIIFIKNFSAKSKSSEKIEKIFIKGINLYRDYYGEQPPPGGKKKTVLKSEAYSDENIKTNKTKKKSNGSKQNNEKTNKKKQKNNKSKNGKKGKGRTEDKSVDEALQQEAGCSCVIL